MFSLIHGTFIFFGTALGIGFGFGSCNSGSFLSSEYPSSSGFFGGLGCSGTSCGFLVSFLSSVLNGHLVAAVISLLASTGRRNVVGLITPPSSLLDLFKDSFLVVIFGLIDEPLSSFVGHAGLASGEGCSSFVVARGGLLNRGGGADTCFDVFVSCLSVAFGHLDAVVIALLASTGVVDLVGLRTPVICSLFVLVRKRYSLGSNCDSDDDGGSGEHG